jgi:hypothetical protein
MSGKKACVIYVPKLKNAAMGLQDLLKKEGFDVCLTEANESTAQAAQAGEITALSAAIQDCMAGAEVCYFLVAEPIPKAVLTQADTVLGKEQRIVVIAEDISKLPQKVDDFADALLKVGSGALGAVVKGEDLWERNDGSAAPPRSPKRVKCQ